MIPSAAGWQLGAAASERSPGSLRRGLAALRRRARMIPWPSQLFAGSLALPRAHVIRRRGLEAWRPPWTGGLAPPHAHVPLILPALGWKLGAPGGKSRLSKHK